MEPRELTIGEASSRLGAGELSAVELMTSVISRIGAIDHEAKACITVRPEADLLADARASDRRRARGEARPLEGIPVALKDNFETAGIRTTAGSKILADWIPGQDATVVTKLRQAGAIIVGKLNMHEFADGPTNDNPHFGRPLNPWDHARTPGGSSGGSAVAIANDMCLAAMGTDTGGSIRTPAAFCGIAGLKPTYGLVSRAGVFPFSWSLDHAGPMGRTCADVAAVLQAIAGPDPADPGSALSGSLGWADESRKEADITVGIETEYLTALMEDGVRDCFSRAIDIFAGLGWTIRELRIPDLDASLAAEIAILFPEAASIHRKYLDERPMDYGEDVRRSLLSGRLYPAETCIEAQRVRAVLRRNVADAFEAADVLAMPTVIIAPPQWGQETFPVAGRELDTLNAFIRCTAPFNLTGNPALSLPCGLTKDGLPVGLQLVGPAFSDARLLRIGESFELARGKLPKPGATNNRK